MTGTVEVRVIGGGWVDGRMEFRPGMIIDMLKTTADELIRQNRVELVSMKPEKVEKKTRTKKNKRNKIAPDYFKTTKAE